MVAASIFVGAFASVILEEIWNKAKNRITEKPATKVFEESAQKLKDKKMLENVNMEDFLKLCDRVEYPNSRKVIESMYQNLSITEKEREQLFKDFREIFPVKKEDQKILFEEFLKILLQEVVENCRDINWKYWVWMQLKKKSEQKILLESFEEALNFDEKEAKWFRGSPFWIDFEENKIFRRREVDTVKKKLERENIQIVHGDAASGKSVIVKYIGYEYCKKPKPVFLINLKTEKLEDYKEDIVGLLDRNVLLIIEDAHLAFHDVDWVVKKASGRKLEVLISARPIEKKIIPREPTKFEILMGREKNFTRIEALDGAEEIIGYYFSKKYGENGF